MSAGDDAIYVNLCNQLFSDELHGYEAVDIPVNGGGLMLREDDDHGTRDMGLFCLRDLPRSRPALLTWACGPLCVALYHAANDAVVHGNLDQDMCMTPAAWLAPRRARKRKLSADQAPSTAKRPCTDAKDADASHSPSRLAPAVANEVTPLLERGRHRRVPGGESGPAQPPAGGANAGAAVEAASAASFAAAAASTATACAPAAGAAARKRIVYASEPAARAAPVRVPPPRVQQRCGERLVAAHVSAVSVVLSDPLRSTGRQLQRISAAVKHEENADDGQAPVPARTRRLFGGGDRPLRLRSAPNILVVGVDLGAPRRPPSQPSTQPAQQPPALAPVQASRQPDAQCLYAAPERLE